MAITVLKLNPYKRTTWEDDIYDPESDIILSEGTPFLAKYINNIEDGIYNAYDMIMAMQRDQQRMQILLELNGRAPGNAGMFTDAFDGEKNLIESASTSTVSAVSAGATTITVADASAFEALQFVTVYDDETSEDTLITAVSGNVITVQALTNSYKKGAQIGRSTVEIDTDNKIMTTAPWTTYSVTVSDVI